MRTAAVIFNRGQKRRGALISGEDSGSGLERSRAKPVREAAVAERAGLSLSLSLSLEDSLSKG